jgi:hypothetical protein
MLVTVLTPLAKVVGNRPVAGHPPSSLARLRRVRQGAGGMAVESTLIFSVTSVARCGAGFSRYGFESKPTTLPRTEPKAVSWRGHPGQRFAPFFNPDTDFQQQETQQSLPLCRSHRVRQQDE